MPFFYSFGTVGEWFGSLLTGTALYLTLKLASPYYYGPTMYTEEDKIKVSIIFPDLEIDLEPVFDTV